MKRFFLLCQLSLFAILALAQGIPVIQNFKAKEYHGNSLNYDIDVDKDGIVYVANFEGLLYYDQVDWHIIHTPGITRVTVVYCDENDVVWTGGYNFFGQIKKQSNGELYLQRIGKPDLFRGEVEDIWEKDGSIFFLASNSTNATVYEVRGDSVSVKRKLAGDSFNVGLSDIIETHNLEQSAEMTILSDSIIAEALDGGLTASLHKGKGIRISDRNGKKLYAISEANGLVSDDVIYIAYDHHGKLWGVSNEGIFAIAVPSAFTQFNLNEGVHGEILAIEEYQDKKYVGTLQGLFRQEGMSFERVGNINHACWSIRKSREGLLAGTANGVYLISGNEVRQLTTTSTTFLFGTDSAFYSGESDGLYLRSFSDGQGQKVCELEKVTKILKDAQGTIWLQNIYGEIWCKKSQAKAFKPYEKKGLADQAATIVLIDGKVTVVKAEDSKPFPYPLFSYTDDMGTTWLTDNSGKSLYRWKDGHRKDDMIHLLTPLKEKNVRALFCKGNEVWVGCDDGIWIINTSIDDPILQSRPRLLFRSITEGGKHVLWGGFGEMPNSLPVLSSHERNLRFTYAIDYATPVGKTLYRYRLNNGQWSSWDEDGETEFSNMTWGAYKLEVQALLTTGEITSPTVVYFTIAYPFYLRWYMLLLYLLLASALIYALFRFRLHRLKIEKLRLEKVVEERTAEVVQQKDEIEEKSKNLEKALDDLSNAQHELIRQEKMATVGKLTQGLIDRILNPLNYINNFSKLSEGLVKDVKANLEDEKEQLSEDNYEDTIEVLDMLTGNLQKVGQHGQSTTRTLKAMEEMLKDRSGGVVKMNLNSLLSKDEEMVNKYYSKEIQQHGIRVLFTMPQAPTYISANPDQLSKTFMSLLGNSIYAIVKKCAQTSYEPEVTMTMTVEGQQARLSFKDNGIGIEPQIINKIFDPFFTTKTTGEASGIGLYLSHEIIQNYGGDITVVSVKSEFTEFTITLPTIKE